ncbi:T9SS type B sorting domain-containing protein [Spongiimicrobium sp. 2-473A-2-J]|uniref:T9SS type B sorting domain-containing protein n=1 Tax=Eudoraea algarum TaxID=3417568 RepID=UPI003D36DFB3
MKKKFLYLLVLIGVTGFSQQCPQLLTPMSGTTNVPVETVISWEEITGVPGYRIAIGSTPGADDIIQDQSVGSSTSFAPPLGLPENTQVWITITLFFFNGGNVTCSSIPFTTEAVTTVPECADLRLPANGAVDVNIGTNIAWNYAPRATAYILTVGTTPGGTDIVDNLNVGNVLLYNPPTDFSTNTPIFVEITPTNTIGPNTSCPVQSFTTGDVAILPGCTTLRNPVNGQTNVPLTPFLQWDEVPGAVGYRVSIGTNPFENNILQDAVFNDPETFVIEFEPNRSIFVRIIPFNASGDAIGCAQETFSTAIGCGPFLNPQTGELISLFPELNFPDAVSICVNALPATLSTDAVAQGFRWTRTTQAGTVIEDLSDTREAAVSEAGFYRLEVFNFADPGGNNIPCPAVQDFTVLVLPGPTITSVDVQSQGEGLQLTVNATGAGDYEYALNNEAGPYQDSNVFNNVPLGNNTVYVRDKNELDCIVSKLLEQDLISEGFPNFFTPNGDGINDFWQFVPPPNAQAFSLVSISIFNRFGQLLVQVDPNSQGWNGTFNGRPLPSTDYWFRAVGVNNEQFTGHFSLRR